MGLISRLRTANMAMILIHLTVFIDTMGNSVVIPIMPFYVLAFGGSSTELGYLISLYALTAVMSMLIMGPMSDRIGRRPTVLISLIGSCVAFALQGLAWNYTSLLIFRGIGGLFAGTITVAQAYITDVVPSSEVPKYMGSIGAVFVLAYLFGPSIGSGLSEFGISIPLYVSSGFSLISFLFAIAYLPETKKDIIAKKKHASSSSSRDEELEMQSIDEKDDDDSVQEDDNEDASAPLTQADNPHYKAMVYFYFSIAFFLGFGSTGFFTLFALYTAEYFSFSSLEIGFVYTGLAVATVISQTALFSALRSRFNASLLTLAIIGCIIEGFGLFFTSYFSNSIWLTLMCPLIMFIGWGLFQPTIPSLLSHITDEENQGKILGQGRAAQSLARVIAPTVLGIVYDNYGPKLGFAIPGVSAWIGACLAIYVARRYKHKEVEEKPIRRMLNALIDSIGDEEQFPLLDEEKEKEASEIGIFLIRMLEARNYNWREKVPELKGMLSAEFPMIVSSEEDPELHRQAIRDIVSMGFDHHTDFTRAYGF